MYIISKLFNDTRQTINNYCSVIICLQEIETIELVKGEHGLGFSIAGGVDFPVEVSNYSINID